MPHVVGGGAKTMQILQIIKLKDGTIFENQLKALEHCENAAGEELDLLLKIVPAERMSVFVKVELFKAMLKQPEAVQEIAAWLKEREEIKKADY